MIVEEAERERKKKNIIIINGLELADEEKLTDWFAQKLEMKFGIRKI